MLDRGAAGEADFRVAEARDAVQMLQSPRPERQALGRAPPSRATPPPPRAIHKTVTPEGPTQRGRHPRGSCKGATSGAVARRAGGGVGGLGQRGSPQSPASESMQSGRRQKIVPAAGWHGRAMGAICGFEVLMQERKRAGEVVLPKDASIRLKVLCGALPSTHLSAVGRPRSALNW